MSSNEENQNQNQNQLRLLVGCRFVKGFQGEEEKRNFKIFKLN